MRTDYSFFHSFFLVLSSVFGTVLVLVLVLGIFELIAEIKNKMDIREENKVRVRVLNTGKAPFHF